MSPPAGDKNIKKFPFIVRSKHRINLDLKSFLVNFWAKMAKTRFPYANYDATLCKNQNKPMNGF